MSARVFLLSLTVLAFGCASPKTCQSFGDSREPRAVDVTFRELNLEPAKYEGQWVRVRGKISSGFEARSLQPEDAPVVAFQYRGLGLPPRGRFGESVSRICNKRSVTIVGVYTQTGDVFDIGILDPVASVRIVE